MLRATALAIFADVTTEEELAKLEAEGTPTEARVWVTHRFGHFGSEEAEREAFREALRTGGFGTQGDFAEIGSDEELEGDGYWHHWSFTVARAEPDELRSLDRRAAEIAARHDVRYDGWEVARHGPGGSPHTQ
jgi:hypothetical protein